MRGPSGRGASRSSRQHGPVAFHQTRNTAFFDISSGANQSPAHGFHESRITAFYRVLRPSCGEKGRLGVCPTGIRAVVGHDGIIDDGTVREFGGDPSLHSGSDLRLIAIPSLLAVAGSLVLGSACYPTVASGTIPAIRRRFNASVTKLHSPWTLRSPRSENCRNPNLAFNHPKTGSTSPLRRA